MSDFDEGYNLAVKNCATVLDEAAQERDAARAELATVKEELEKTKAALKYHVDGRAEWIRITNAAANAGVTKSIELRLAVEAERDALKAEVAELKARLTIGK